MTQSQFAVCSSSQPLLMSKLDWFQIRHCSGRKRTFPPNPSCLGWTIFLSGFKNFCPTIQQKVCPVLYSDYQNCFLPFLRFFCVFRKCACAAAEFVWICFDETFSWRVGMQMSLSASCDEGRYKDQLSFKTNSTNTNENTNRNTDAERVAFENKWISINIAAIAYGGEVRVTPHTNIQYIWVEVRQWKRSNIRSQAGSENSQSCFLHLALVQNSANAAIYGQKLVKRIFGPVTT